MRFQKMIMLSLVLILSWSGPSWAQAGKKGARLKMSQPEKVSQFQKASLERQTRFLLVQASQRAQASEESVNHVLNVMSMSSWQRWQTGVKISEAQSLLAINTSEHLKQMSQLMKARRSAGRLPQYQEFEFRNLMAKSEYILSLGVTREAFEGSKNDPQLLARIKSSLELYNQERVRLDGRSIQVNL